MEDSVSCGHNWMQVRVYMCHKLRQHSFMNMVFIQIIHMCLQGLPFTTVLELPFLESSSCQASRVPSPRTTIAMAASAALRRVMAQDPVLTACAVLSAIGLGAPLIVPPIRNSMNRPEPITPPKLANVVEGMTVKARN